MPRRIAFALMLLSLLALTGCASLAPSKPVSIPADLNQLERWHARGRLGVSSAEGGGSGSFEWRQRGDHSDVQIRGPVGIGSVRLQVRGAADHPSVRLETSDGQILESDAAWDELEARLGAPMPAGRLRYWMLGLAAPGEHQWREQNSDGVTTLEQDGWRIDYQNYATDPGARVPTRIRASSGDARVRIVVDRWRLGS
jgi:outer membrane lipoprotein LolB